MITDKKNVLELSLPIPPSANHLWTIVGKKMVRTAKYRQWLGNVEAVITEARIKADLPKISQPCTIYIGVWEGRGFRTNRDLDNVFKPCLDALTHFGVIKGDSVKNVTGIEALYKTFDGFAWKEMEARCQIIIRGAYRGHNDENPMDRSHI